MESTGEPATAGMADPPSTEQLLQAAASADDEDLRRLTQYYTTDIDIRNQDGLSALHLAILSHHDGAVEALVEANADIEATTPDGRRPLFLAIEGSRTEVVRFLLAHHALADADAGGRMPLHEAASRGNVHIARLLLDYGADIQALSTDERDALFFAVRSQDLAVAQLLLDRGADPDAYLSEDPPTALHLASELCDVEMMRMLLERRAKVDLRDFNGATPLFRVVAAGNIEAAKLLLQHGASIRVWASGGFSALDLADGNLEMLELLNGDRVLQGPKVRGAGPADEPEATFTVLKPPPTPAEHERDKLTACQGFNAIITDFFLNGEEHEQSVPKTASVYELLYSHGPGAIRSRLDGRDPSYTWYHLPSNNMVWVEKNLHEHLFRGYFNSGTSDLQPRRTLDQYVYADIEASSNRDNDQVVYRYTKDSRAKIFMVDQLWLWILGEDTIITCCPVRWNSWETKRQRQAEMPTAETSKPGFYIKWFSGMVHNPHASLVRQRGMGYRPMMIGGHSSKEPRASQPSRNWADGTWPELKLDDPLNVSQIVNRHLLKQNRSAVESVFELAGLITTCCVDLFDPHQVSEDYLFLDFFENSIGQASDKVANYLRNFKGSVSEFKEGVVTEDIMDITSETELMIELDDILDELHTLKLVLTDQKSVVQDMNRTLRESDRNASASAHVNTKTLESHLQRIEQMEQAASKAEKTLHRLVDLKQKQASLTEAWYARESARDTARQGKTVVVFTVVTIIFLPVSFIAAIFAIDSNGFRRDEDDKIPFGYMLTYILSIGLTISIPLIVIAFNVDRIARWFGSLRGMFGRFWHISIVIALAAAVLTAVIGPVWTSKLAGGIKASVSIVLIMLLVVAAIGLTMHKLMTSLSRKVSVTTSSGSSWAS
ncbi:RNA polymerase II subunit A C-terminal domain phosphatase SSU72 [Verticillium dahliae VDG2]|nr:RNA polymerase II subunit A C-terminal domain phosphatase SSU72 [Verticillium dahliae VDG2]